MSSKLDDIIQIITDKRTGNLTGRAVLSRQNEQLDAALFNETVFESASQLESNTQRMTGSRSFALLFRLGELQMATFAGLDGIEALSLLLNDATIEKSTWFSMAANTIPNNNVPLVSNKDFLSALNHQKIAYFNATQTTQESLKIATVTDSIYEIGQKKPQKNETFPTINKINDVSVTTLQFGLKFALNHHTLKQVESVFKDFFGKDSEKLLYEGFIKAGANPSQSDVLQQFILILEPLVGEEFAKDYFKDFL